MHCRKSKKRHLHSPLFALFANKTAVGHIKTLIMYKIWLLLLLFSFQTVAAQPTPYEKGNGNQSSSYAECIAWYQQLAAVSAQVRIDSVGRTDIGQPLHQVVISTGTFDPAAARKAGKAVVLINNGIHPGEPEGIDASMRLARELATDPQMQKLLQQLVVVIVPIFNVDGALMRNSFTRANQNGPEQYGFRGNARNLDLNRDFVKLDSENARALVQLYRRWDADLYLETHTTNGADYQHVMTLIETQKDKLRPEISGWMQQKFTPKLYKDMQKQGFPMCPYVNTKGELPESGLQGFLETPRYGSGYMATFHTPGYVLETHMLKPFAQRYQATYQLLKSMLITAAAEAPALLQARKAAQQACAEAERMALNWQLEEDRVDSFFFRGYTARYKKSEVHNGQRLYYDRNAPWQGNIPYQNHFLGTDSTSKPLFYLIPQAWQEVIIRLGWNGVEMQRLQRDTLITVERYFIQDYKTSNRVYEGHFYHNQVQLLALQQERQYRKGDVLVPLGHATDRFVMEVLEPRAVDSYFRWNFFDSMLQRKEYFSGYVFEDTAAELLRNDAALRAAYEEWKSTQAADRSPWNDLYFIYSRSPLAEPDFMMYPVGRIIN